MPKIIDDEPDTIVIDVTELALPRTPTTTLAPIVTPPATMLRGAVMMPHRSRTLIPIVRIELDELEEVA